MTHEDYLEKHHEIANAVFASVAMKFAQNKADEAKELLTRARATLDTLWEQRRQTAERTVNP